MKTFKISRGLEVVVDDSDYKRLIASKSNYRSEPLRWQATYCSTDKVRRYYASKTINYKKWKLHRYIFFLRGIDITGKEIDHINNDPLDNRFSNLRIANSSQNKGNASIRFNNTSGYKGVGWHKQRGKWRAYIGKSAKSLGLFDTKEEAALAYNIAAIEKWGPYAKLNNLRKP